MPSSFLKNTHLPSLALPAPAAVVDDGGLNGRSCNKPDGEPIMLGKETAKSAREGGGEVTELPPLAPLATLPFPVLWLRPCSRDHVDTAADMRVVSST